MSLPKKPLSKPLSTSAWLGGLPITGTQSLLQQTRDALIPSMPNIPNPETPDPATPPPTATDTNPEETAQQRLKRLAAYRFGFASTIKSRPSLSSATDTGKSKLGQ